MGNMKVMHLLPILALAWASLLSTTLAFRASDYANALDKTILFYDLQRSGWLPSWQRLRWRGGSGTQDGRANGVRGDQIPSDVVVCSWQAIRKMC